MPPADGRCLTVYLAAADGAAHYRPQQLCAADRQRLADNPLLGKRPGWQVSRFLRQQAGLAATTCLSHSGAHAAAVAAGAGVDIETLRARRFEHWLQWPCSADERQWLQQRGGRTQDYYVLWTLKEALIKAAGLEWADLGRVGVRQSAGGWQLHAGSTPHWQGRSVEISRSHVASCVWPADGADEVYWQGFGVWQQAKLEMLAVFR